MGFLAGVIACLHAMRDAKIPWPPAALWDVLSQAQRVELCGGVAMMVIAFFASLVGKDGQP
jgi:hypothetical protein